MEAETIELRAKEIAQELSLLNAALEAALALDAFLEPSEHQGLATSAFIEAVRDAIEEREARFE